MWYNAFTSAILRSPLQAMLGDTMLITVTGRKSGAKYTAPVGFYRDGDTLWVMSSRDRTWWRNLRGGACVTLHLHGRDVDAFAEAVMDEETVAARLADYVRRIPMSARSLGVRVEDGVANPDDAARLAKEKVFVKISNVVG
jgi:deazaflavin-dependent oxidoreductase (nitroreductase family)